MKKNKKSTTGFSSVYSRAFIWFLIISHLVFVIGCTTAQVTSVSTDKIPAGEGVKILRVSLKSGETILFNEDGGKYIEKQNADTLSRVIVGITPDEKVVKIGFEKVQDVQIETRTSDTRGSINVALYIVFAIPIVMLVIWIAKIPRLSM